MNPLPSFTGDKGSLSDLPALIESKLVRRTVVASLLILMFLLTSATIFKDTPTLDEPIHVYSGYTHLTTGDLSVNPEHPPLVKEFSALPLLFFDLDFREPEVATLDVQRDYAIVFFYGGENNPNLLLTSSRIMMIILLMLAALILYLFACELFGYGVGLLALLLAAISPVFLAYGRLVTLDIASAATMMLTLYIFWKFIHNPKPSLLILCAAALGLTMMTQNSALTLIPVLLLLAVIHALRERRSGASRAVSKALARYALILLLAICLVGAYYGIHTNTMPDEDISAIIDTNLPRDSLGHSFVKGLNRVSPPLSIYATGILRNYYFNKMESGEALIYLNNKAQPKPFWYYYPEAFLLKTPLGVLILLLLAILFFPWRELRLNEAFILLPMIALMLFTVFIRAQFGIKYLIPLYAFLYIFIARGIVRMFSVIKRKWVKTAGVVMVTVLLVFSAISMLTVMPHLIPYFNYSIGSRDNGYHYLAEHNVDWGQDIKYLADFVEEEGITHLETALYEIGLYASIGGYWRLSAYYMPECSISLFDGHMDEGWLALSTSFRKNLMYFYPEFVSYLDGLEPYAIINHSILIYYLEDGWPLEDSGAEVPGPLGDLLPQGAEKGV